MFFAGMAWMAVVNVLQVAMKMALPEWVRARELSIFQTTIMGGVDPAQAARRGGQLATVYGLSTAYAMAAAGAVRARGGRAHDSTFSTGPDEDFTLTRHWEEPSIGKPIENDQGPLWSASKYCIDPQRAPDFIALIEESKRMRSSTTARGPGASSATPPIRANMWNFSSTNQWVAHLRQHDRVTAADRDLPNTASACLVDSKAAAKYQHFITGRPSLIQMPSGGVKANGAAIFAIPIRLIRIISFAVLLFGTRQQAAHEREMEIRVTGKAIVMVKPDQVEIDIGVRHRK